VKSFEETLVAQSTLRASVTDLGVRMRRLEQQYIVEDTRLRTSEKEQSAQSLSTVSSESMHV
jgi:hypothetical protein